MIRGWCPDLHTPMPSGDGWLARIKPWQPRIVSAMLRKIADAATRHGNGLIELTSRGNIQIRGLTPDSALAFATEMVAAQLALPDISAERRRNVITSPLAGRDATCDPTTSAVAAALIQALIHADDLALLPGKFLFAVDGGGLLPLGDAGADIVLRAITGTWHISVGGKRCIRTDADHASQQAIALAHSCLTISRPPARTHSLRTRYSEAELFAGLGETHQMPQAASAMPIDIASLGLPFGRLDAETVANIADKHGDGTILLTPWRTVLLPGVLSQANLPGDFIRSPQDPRSRIIACPGQPSCANAHADIRADAARLAQSLSQKLHLSGCAKGCAHPGSAALTLVATPTGYNLIRHGSACDTPIATALSVQAAASMCATFDRTAA